MKKKIIYLIFAIALISSFFILYITKNTYRVILSTPDYKYRNFPDSIKNKNFSNDNLKGSVFASPFRITYPNKTSIFENINCSNTNLAFSVFADNIILYNCSFKNANMAANLISTANTESRPLFFNCNFDGVDFNRGRILSGSFNNCSFNNAILAKTTISCSFDNCSFDNTILSESFISASFNKCTFNNVDFTESNLSAIKISKNSVFNNIITNKNTVLPKEMAQIKTLNPNK